MYMGGSTRKIDKKENSKKQDREKERGSQRAAERSSEVLTQIRCQMINLLVKLDESELLTLEPAKQNLVSGETRSSDFPAQQDRILLVENPEVQILLKRQQLSEVLRSLTAKQASDVLTSKSALGFFLH